MKAVCGWEIDGWRHKDRCKEVQSILKSGTNLYIYSHAYQITVNIKQGSALLGRVHDLDHP